MNVDEEDCDMFESKQKEIGNEAKSNVDDEEYVDERKLHVYIKKLRALEAQKHNVSEQLKARHAAQLNKMIQQQQLQLQNIISPFNAAIGETFENVQSEIIALEKQIGVSDGRYCRYCFVWSKCRLHCRKCERIICSECAIQCSHSDCTFAFCPHCNNDVNGFWIEEYGKLHCPQCCESMN